MRAVRRPDHRLHREEAMVLACSYGILLIVAALYLSELIKRGGM